jgi:hypothetical protein
MRQLVFYLLLCIQSTIYGQYYIGYYKCTSKVAGLGSVTRIHLDDSANFEYVSAFDLFYDRVFGKYSAKNDTIQFIYPPSESIRLCRIDTIKKTYKGKTPYSFYIIDTTYTNIPVSFFVNTETRPNELLYRKNKLFYLVGLQSEMKRVRKMKLKRIEKTEWNNSGADFMRLVPGKKY